MGHRILLLLTATLVLVGCAEDGQTVQNPFENGFFGGKLGTNGLLPGGTVGKADLLGGGSFFDSFLPSSARGGNTSDTETVAQVIVSSTGATQTIDRSDRYDLTVSGADNVLTVGDDNDVRKLLVSGDRNTVTVGRGTQVETLELTGFNNLIRVPSSSGITIARDTGADNTLETY